MIRYLSHYIILPKKKYTLCPGVLISVSMERECGDILIKAGSRQRSWLYHSCILCSSGTQLEPNTSDRWSWKSETATTFWFIQFSTKYNEKEWLWYLLKLWKSPRPINETDASLSRAALWSVGARICGIVGQGLLQRFLAPKNYIWYLIFQLTVFRLPIHPGDKLYQRAWEHLQQVLQSKS